MVEIWGICQFQVGVSVVIGKVGTGIKTSHFPRTRFLVDLDSFLYKVKLKVNGHFGGPQPPNVGRYEDLSVLGRSVQLVRWIPVDKPTTFP
jgi:hypothetical protein